MSVSKSTSEPFGVVFDSAKGGAVAEATIDHSVDGQEVCHSAGKETSIWESEGCTERAEEEIKKEGQDTGGEIAQGQKD